MNCLEFRRRFEAEPAAQDPELTRHRRECALCSAYVAKSAHFERKLGEAMRVEVPEGLISRIRLRQAFCAEHRRLRWRRLGLALAATLVLTMGVVVTGLREAPSAGLDRAVLELIAQAQFSFQPRDPVALERIRSVLQPLGVDLTDEIGTVTFASPCVVRGRLAGHLVVQGEKAPITVLLMPRERVRERAPLTDDNMNGYLLPADEGAIAIIGAPGERLEAIEQRVRAAVRWQA